MSRLLLILALLNFPWMGGCERASADAKVLNSLTSTIEALEKADWATLWLNSAPQVQNELLSFHRKLAGARERVRRTYRAEKRDEALSLLGDALLGDLPLEGEEVGPQLLSRLFDRGILRLEERVTRLTRSTAVTLADGRAVLHSTTGQVYNFIETNEGWRSMLLSQLLDNAEGMKRLQESMSAFERRLDEEEEAWRRVNDPTQPQGAINLARRAGLHTPVDAKVLYALLDAHARETVKTAYASLDTLRNQLTKKLGKRARREHLKEMKLAELANAKSPEELFALWCQSDTFIPPIRANEMPIKLASPPSQGFAVISLSSARPVQLSEDPQGTWRIVGIETVLKRALVTPIEAGLKNLEGPKR